MSMDGNIAERASVLVELEKQTIELNKRLGQAITGENVTLSENADNIERLNAELEKTLYGTDTGGKSYYDEFWDALQASGGLIDYRCSFGYAWNDTSYNPKYPIIVKNAESMYSFSRISEKKIEFDSSQCTNFTKTFYYANCKYIGTVDCTAYKNAMSYTFSYVTKLISIDKLILNENNKFNNTTFQGTTDLEKMIVEGVIGQSGFDVQWCTKLNKESIISIISALSDSTSSLTITLSKTAVKNAFETADGLADGDNSVEWTSLVGTKANWTISLV